MALEEKSGKRNLDYSMWHRPESLARFIDADKAKIADLIDIDCAEALGKPYWEIIVLLETAVDRGRDYKPTVFTENLGRRSYPQIPVYLLFYKLSDQLNPAAPKIYAGRCPRCSEPLMTEFRDIESFRAKQISPVAEKSFTNYTPKEWALKLWQIREQSKESSIEIWKQGQLGHLRAVWKELNARYQKKFLQEHGKQYPLDNTP